MDTRYPVRMLSVGCILTFLVCTGIFFYTRAKNRQFVKELPQPPQSDVSRLPMEQRELTGQTHSGQMPPAATVVSENFGDDEIPDEGSGIEKKEVVPEETDASELDGESDILSLPEAELSENLEEPLVEDIDLAETKEAWQDYNDLLSIDPDLAYTRLGEGFRDMYGDRPEVDIIVENIRRANEGTLTVDNAIDLMKASLKIIPADQTEAIADASDKLELLYDLKAFEAEGGKPIIKLNMHIGEE